MVEANDYRAALLLFYEQNNLSAFKLRGQNSDSGMPDCRAMLFSTPVFTKPFIPC